MMAEKENYDREIADWVRAHRKMSIVLLLIVFGCLLAFAGYELLSVVRYKGAIPAVALLVPAVVATLFRVRSLRKGEAAKTRVDR